MLLTVTQGPRLKRCQPDTGHQEHCLDVTRYFRLTFCSPKQATRLSDVKGAGKYHPTTCLSRKNRNTWLAALMPILSRMTHLSGPMGFLECRTVGAETEKVQANRNKLFTLTVPCYTLFADSLLNDCITVHQGDESWFSSRMPYS